MNRAKREATMRATLIDYATMGFILMSVAFSPAVVWIIVSMANP
jgi:hypothetical protein